MGKTSGSRRGGRPKGSGPKRKRVMVKFIERRVEHTGLVTEPYRIMEEVIKTRRADLKDVKIGIAWRIGWRPDSDGRRTLGQCRKRGDLDRELDAWDFIILLNEDAWPTFKDRPKERLIFHELGHAQIVSDTNGQPKRDDRGRLVTRIRKHDIQDFRDVVEIYGWEEDLNELAERGIADAQRPLLAEAEKKEAEFRKDHPGGILVMPAELQKPDSPLALGKTRKATVVLTMEATEGTDRGQTEGTGKKKKRSTKKSMAE